MNRKTQLLTAIALVVSCSAWAAEKDTVKYRQNNMHIIGGHMGSIVAIIKGEVPNKDELKAHADGLAAMAPLVKAAFKTEAMTDKSEALPKIWKDWDSFAKAADDLEAASVKLASAVATGNPAGIGASLGGVGDSCKGCHDKFTKD